MNDKDTKRTKFAMYANQLIGSLGLGLASPFIPYYAAYLALILRKWDLSRQFQTSFLTLFNTYGGSYQISSNGE